METNKKVSQVVVRRLPRYYRYLAELEAEGKDRISSMELAKRMNVTASQIRQDFNCFGGFGQQGYGYNVSELYVTISKILGLDKEHKTVIIGAGNLGHAIANYHGFEKRGFKLVGIFDVDKGVCGNVINGIRVMPIDEMDEVFKTYSPDIAVLTIPKDVAQSITDKVCALGIRGIWNFSHKELKVPDGVKIENVHLSDSLMTLSHAIAEGR